MINTSHVMRINYYYVILIYLYRVDYMPCFAKKGGTKRGLGALPPRQCLYFYSLHKANFETVCWNISLSAQTSYLRKVLHNDYVKHNWALNWDILYMYIQRAVKLRYYQVVDGITSVFFHEMMWYDLQFAPRLHCGRGISTRIEHISSSSCSYLCKFGHSKHWWGNTYIWHIT